jgi:hypothetical protein
MAVDLRRWQSLREQYEEQRSLSRGLMAELTGLRDRY